MDGTVHPREQAAQASHYHVSSLWKHPSQASVACPQHFHPGISPKPFLHSLPLSSSLFHQSCKGLHTGPGPPNTLLPARRSPLNFLRQPVSHTYVHQPHLDLSPLRWCPRRYLALDSEVLGLGEWGNPALAPPFSRVPSQAGLPDRPRLPPKGPRRLASSSLLVRSQSVPSHWLAAPASSPSTPVSGSWLTPGPSSDWSCLVALGPLWSPHTLRHLPADSLEPGQGHR